MILYIKKLTYMFGVGLLLSVAIPVIAAEPIPVKTATFSELAVYPERSAPAVTISLNDAPMAAQIAARIESIPVKVGDVVGKGDLLARLECSDYRLNYREAQARLSALDARIDLAVKKLERTRGLAEKQAVSDEILDERESDLEVLRADRNAAEATKNLAKLNESRCTVKSPYKAVVTTRTGSEGQYVSVGTTLVRIMDLSTLEVSAQVFSGDIDQINENTKLYFEFAGKRYPVGLRVVVPIINSETRNREVRLVFTDVPALPGSAGKLTWQDPRPHVPGNLLVRRGEELGIFIANDSHARFIPLPSAQAGRPSPAELTGTTAIVTEGRYALTDGVPLAVSR